MIVNDILKMDIVVKDDPEIVIRDGIFNERVSGSWYQDDILDYLNCKVESFTWQDDKTIYIDVI